MSCVCIWPMPCILHSSSKYNFSNDAACGPRIVPITSLKTKTDALRDAIQKNRIHTCGALARFGGSAPPVTVAVVPGAPKKYKNEMIYIKYILPNIYGKKSLVNDT